MSSTNPEWPTTPLDSSTIGDTGNLDALLRLAYFSNASDVHLHSGSVIQFRINGRLVLRVTQPSGRVYYLQEDPANPVSRDGLGNILRVPMWVLREF